jgi:hypothetical protein
MVFSLTVTDSDGFVDTEQVTIAIDPPPVANASASASVVLAGTTVTLDGSQSVDAASFFGGRPQAPPPSSAIRGRYRPTFVAESSLSAFEVVTFELTVQDSCGARSTDSVSVVVVAP